jgi:hypothetical protein
MGTFESMGKFERTAVRYELNQPVIVIRTSLSPMLYHRPTLGGRGKRCPALPVKKTPIDLVETECTYTRYEDDGICVQRSLYCPVD